MSRRYLVSIIYSILFYYAQKKLKNIKNSNKKYCIKFKKNIIMEKYLE